MTDKEKILAFLEGMSKGCCPNETKEIIINKIIPWINDLPEEHVSEDLEKVIDDYLDNRMALRLDWKQCNITFNASQLIKFANHIAQWQEHVDNNAKRQIHKNAVEYGKRQTIDKAIEHPHENTLFSELILDDFRRRIRGGLI